MNSNQYSYIQNPQSIGQMPIPGGGVAPQVPMRPMSRRARMGQRLMSGIAMRIHQLPSWFAMFAVATYAIAAIGVNMVFSAYAIEWYFGVIGIIWVAGFFYLSVKFSQDWNISRVHKSKLFEKKIFWTGFLIRVVYVLFAHYFYSSMTGEPYEFQAADSSGYWGTAHWFAEEYARDNLWNTLRLFSKDSFSDIGYPLLMTFPDYWFERHGALMFMRIINALLGSYTAVIIYRLCARSMGETTARIASVFTMLHPVLIFYAGITLKEVIMTFILVAFIDLSDRMLRGRRYTFATVAPVVLLGLSLFMFRTVLGMIAFMAVFFSLVMMDSRIVGFGKKIMLGGVLVGILLMAVSENIRQEIERISQTDAVEQQEKSLRYRYGEERGGGVQGNAFAKYAGAAVFAPLIFTIPFPTVVVVPDQEDMRMIHGGNWMRNIMSGFVILAMVMLLLTGDWRKYTVPLAMLLGYLLMLTFTEFAHSLRFHVPVMPFEMMFAAYAITNMRKKHKNWYLIWCLSIMVACFAWNWFKLRGRGL